ncbi:MAG: phosphotyrosine protein phosphatase [Bacteroidota bacterium]
MNKNILFVCSANKQRSKTAEDYFSIHYPNLNFQSAGTNLKICQKEGTNPITQELLTWADTIIVMESNHSKLIKEFSSNKCASKIVILSIEDKYRYFQQELIDLLVVKATKYFVN